MKHRHKRGYPIAVLVGFEEKRAVLWQLFSKVVKHYVTVELEGKDKKDLYNFREAVVNQLRPLLKEGVRSIVVVAPTRTNYAKDFLDHARRCHPWLFRQDSTNSAAFAEISVSADQIHEVSYLLKTEKFRKLLREITSADADRVMDTFEKRLGETEDGVVVLYSLEDIEKILDSRRHDGLKPEYIMLTDRYLADTKEKSRVYRLLQISRNKDIKTKIVDSETKSGIRLSQVGGLVCFTKPRID